jgi:serine/threonine-protein kinase
VDSSELIKGDPNVLGRPLGGSFVALKRIGQGGMGTVYEGRQIQFDRIVAIKILSEAHTADPQIMARFEREARSIARVVHPNVVQLIDSGVEDSNIAYIVMEYVKGIELSNIPESELSGQFIIHVAQQVLNALSEAHAMNVIHRDLKPDNIMITRQDGDNRFVKVLDFGLAALTDRAKITMSGQALGTPWYMSPEQATASNVTAASDLYSLGCVLYELATSRPPFPGNRPFNVMLQHVNAEVPPLVLRPEVELSPDMIAFILKCLQKSPSDRYASANDALEALYRIPEWVAAGQSNPSQSLRLSMMQLSEMSRVRSDVISGISATLDSSDNGVVLRSGDLSAVRSASHPIVEPLPSGSQPIVAPSPARSDQFSQASETLFGIRFQTLFIALLALSVLLVILLVILLIR